MEPQELQSDSAAKPPYFDPAPPDTSEQQFAASLDPTPQPNFVLETGEAVFPEMQPITSPAPNSSGDSRPRLPDQAELEVTQPDHEPKSAFEPDWRNQVSAKVNH